MDYERTNHAAMTLIDGRGERKYLNAAERQRFYQCLDVLASEQDRTFCEMIYWTGCRPSEALALTVQSINLDEGSVIIRSLKKRGRDKGKHYRIIPLPAVFLERLVRVHSVGETQCNGRCAAPQRLWCFSRTTGWERMARVMAAADISGVRACARGLRHSFGVYAALMHVPETRIKKWLGHASLATTGIYIEVAGAEDRAMAARMWPESYIIADCEFVPPAVPSNDVSSAELVRLVCAYSAINAKAPRMKFLNGIEASAEDQSRRGHA